jgi:hypothetical protein
VAFADAARHHLQVFFVPWRPCAALEHPISAPARAMLERWLKSARQSLGERATAAAQAAGEAAKQAIVTARGARV